MLRFLGGRARWATAGALLLAGVVSASAVIDPRDYVVPVTAQVRANPAEITLKWPPDPRVSTTTVSRKVLNEETWHTWATLPSDSTSFTDTSVVLGGAYEYEITQRSADGLVAYGYLYAGVEVPFPGVRGRVILIVDSTFSSELTSELEQLRADLVGDGWTVLRHDVSSSSSPPALKALIRADYNADPSNTKAVLLLGHVPVPYSGDINPDLHATHLGAWPADSYYADMEGTWTDAVVQDTRAEDPRNFNVPGDGKFDQSQIPARAVLQVGRVDFTDLPAFAPAGPSDLMRRYLQKNHAFRHKLFDAGRRAVIRDNFGEIQGDAPAVDAWRGFTSFFGPDGIRVLAPGEFFPVLTSESYLWAYGGGGGEYYQADGVGSTSDFARDTPQSVFFMLHGSYFGDWDSSDNLLRAALASPGYGLAAAWTGLPHWFVHPMALGETIGVVTLLAQNNRGLYKSQVNLSPGQVHIALMGDPTLRMHVVAPPAQVEARREGGTVRVTWQSSPDPVRGYYVYRSDNLAGPFARLNRSFLTDTVFVDGLPPAGDPVYMVRAVRLEETPSGTYYNPSQGITAVTQPDAGQTNRPPSLSPIPDQSSVESAPIPAIPFTVADPDTPVGSLVVSATSSDTNLVSADGLLLSGSDAERTLLITPATGTTGSATITVSVSDGELSASRSFVLKINRLARILTISRESVGAVAIEFEGTPGLNYAVEASQDLQEWTALGSGLSGPGDTTRYVDDQVGDKMRRFYRVHWQ